MEDFLEAAGGGVVWGLGFGLAGLLLAGFGRGLRPVAKTIVKGGIVAGDWFREVTEESRESLRDLYEEAKTEQGQAKAERAQAKTEQGQAKPASSERGAEA